MIPGPNHGSPASAGEVQCTARPVLRAYQAAALPRLGEVFAVVIDTS
jgi:hypothetical protein